MCELCGMGPAQEASAEAAVRAGLYLLRASREALLTCPAAGVRWAAQVLAESEDRAVWRSVWENLFALAGNLAWSWALRACGPDAGPEDAGSCAGAVACLLDERVLANVTLEVGEPARALLEGTVHSVLAAAARKADREDADALAERAQEAYRWALAVPGGDAGTAEAWTVLELGYARREPVGLDIAAATPEFLSVVASLLAKEDRQDRSTMERAAGWLRRASATPEFLNALAWLLAHPEKGVREAATNVVMRLGPAAATPEFLSALADLLSHRQGEVRSAAVQAVVELGGGGDDLLRRLPDEYEMVIVLRHLEELAFPEVAERMGRSIDSVKQLWRRALGRLRAVLRHAPAGP